MEQGSAIPTPAIEEARRCVEHCQALIGCLMFWTLWLKVPLVSVYAERRAEELAVDIGATTAAMERWLAMGIKLLDGGTETR